MLQGMWIGVSVKKINSTEPTNGTITSQKESLRMLITRSYGMPWFSVTNTKKIEARKPDIVLLLVDKKKKEVKIIDVAIPGDVRVCEKELEKIDKYKHLKDEIARFYGKWGE